MSTRSVGRVGRKATAARKRKAVKDLAAHKGRGVVGGLLPAIQAGREPALTGDHTPVESIGFVYGKM